MWVSVDINLHCSAWSACLAWCEIELGALPLLCVSVCLCGCACHCARAGRCTSCGCVGGYTRVWVGVLVSTAAGLTWKTFRSFVVFFFFS